MSTPVRPIAAAPAVPLRALLALVATCGGSGSQGGGDGGPTPDCTLTEVERTLAPSITTDLKLVRACSPYYMAGPVTVSAALTIDPGVVVETCSGGCESRLTITGPEARLVSNGDPGAPVVFRPRVPPDLARPGEWTGIMIRSAATGSLVEHTSIEHAGGMTRGRPEFGNDDLMTNAGLVVWDTLGVKVKDSRFLGNRYYGLRMRYADDANDGKALEGFSGNTFAGNTTAAIRVPVNQLGLVGADNCFGGRDTGGKCLVPKDARAEGAIVEADQGEGKGQFLTRDATWKPLGVPYRLVDGAVIRNATLTVAEPNEIQVGIASITIGLNSGGALKAVAKIPRGIKFVSAAEMPTPGDWDGILFEQKADPGASLLEGIEVAHAGRSSWRGGEGKAAIWIYDSNPTVRDAYVHDTAGGAVHWNCASRSTVDGTTWDRVQCKPEAKQNWGCSCSPFTACKPVCM